MPTNRYCSKETGSDPCAGRLFEGSSSRRASFWPCVDFMFTHVGGNTGACPHSAKAEQVGTGAHSAKPPGLISSTKNGAVRVRA